MNEETKNVIIEKMRSLIRILETDDSRDRLPIGPEVDEQRLLADSNICVNREDGADSPTIGFLVPIPYDPREYLEANVSFDVFLESTRDIYSCGDAGWGEVMISDLELLQSKIGEAIEKMREEIRIEQEE